MTVAQGYSVVGLVVALVGVLTLFRYGMPYRVETKGESALLLEEVDHDAIREEQRYRVIGWLGLGLIVAGTALQIAGALLA